MSGACPDKARVPSALVFPPFLSGAAVGGLSD